VRPVAGGGRPLTASTSAGSGARADTSTSAMSPSAIGWRRKRFTRTILGMRSLHATVLGPLASGMVAVGFACRPAARAPARPPDAGTMVTVYVAPGGADRVMGRLQLVPARHQLPLSVPTARPAARTPGLPILARTRPSR